MFDSFKQWRICMGAAVIKLSWGLSRVMLYAVTGVAIVLRWLWRLLVEGVKSFPETAIVVSLLVCLFVWAFTFTDGRARVATAEYQRDSLSYKLHQLMHIEDKGEEVVIGDDTIRIFSYDR